MRAVARMLGVTSLGVLAAGCVFHVPPRSEDEGPRPDGGAERPITGLITQDTTWSGSVLIGRDRTTTRIEVGATVAVMPGAVIRFQPGAGLDIQGTLDVRGTRAAKVSIVPSAGGDHYGLALGGTSGVGKLELSYAVMEGGSILVNPGATATITDTKLGRAAGDLLIVNGGTVEMAYSEIGPDPGELDTTHCQIHAGGLASIRITRSNIHGAPYGMMFYGGQNADLRSNNWYGNQLHLDTQPGVSGDVSGSWFEGAPPVASGGATLVGLGALSATKVLDAGVR